MPPSVSLRISAKRLPMAFLALAVSFSMQAQTALMRHAPTVNAGTVEGSIQQMTAEGATLNGNAAITGDLLVPGTPTVRLNGHPAYGGTLDGAGAASPANYQITLNGNASLRHVVRRSDAVALPTVNPPPLPTGTRSVNINNASQSPGDFATLRNLTFNGNAGQLAIPAGAYGDFTANGNSGFTLGVAGATQPSVYSFQHLILNGNSALKVVGPVVVTLANGLAANGAMGATANPAWLTLKIAAGGVTLNGNVSLYGYVAAPSGTVTINGNSHLIGGVACDRLTVNGNGLLRLVALSAVNQPPTVALTMPAAGATFIAPTVIDLAATASDPDGTIAKVEFYSATKLGDGTPAAGQPSTFTLTFPFTTPGTYTLAARATDNLGVTTVSAPAVITVSANQPPTVALSAPANNAVFVAPASIALTATASDSDGSVAKVEFFNGSTKLGEGTPVLGQLATFTLPFTFTVGTYTLTAKAYDSLGLVTTSSPLAITVLATLPYTSDFEAGEGYTQSSLSGQLGWTVNQGAAQIAGQDAAHGVQSVLLSPSTPPAQIEQAFAPLADATIVFVDFFAKPVAETGTVTDAAFNVESSLFGFALNGANGSLQAFDGDGAGNGNWTSTSFTSPVGAGNQTQSWIRLTARLDFTRKTWDLYANSSMVAADLGFRDGSRTYLSSFLVQGDTTTATLVDYLFAGPQNPLFADANNNGLDDAWETAHGLSLTSDNRNATPSGNGVTVVQAYVAGTDPNDYYNGQTPTLTILSGDNQSALVGQFNAEPFVVQVRNAVSTSPLVNAPVTFMVTAGGGLLAETNTDAATLATSLSLRTDSSGTVRVYYQQPATANASCSIRATAGSAQVVFASTSIAPNQPPTVALTAPADGSVFTAPATITLAATATDDSAVTNVEFYANNAKIGEAAATPYTFSWSGMAPGTYALIARAYDSTGQSTDSTPIYVSVNAPALFASDFEEGEGYSVGNIGGQNGWSVATGTAVIQEADAVSGTQVLTASAGAQVSRDLSAIPPGSVVFLDYYVRPTVGASANAYAATRVSAGAAIVSFVRNGDEGEIMRGQDSDGFLSFSGTGVKFPLAPDGRSIGWIHVTFRVDFDAAICDLYIDGKLVAAGLPNYFSDLGTFAFKSTASGPSDLDKLAVTADNPLFVDQDRDGIADTYERANGMDPLSNDRDGDVDHDGLRNIDEYVLGTSANKADTDGDGLSDGWEVQYGLDPKVPESLASLQSDADGDGLTLLQEFQHGTDPNASDTDGDGLSDGDEVKYGLNPNEYDAYNDNDGDGISNYAEILQGTDPNDYYNGKQPVLTSLMGPSRELDENGVYRVLVTASDGTPLSNAPVTMRITSGTSRFIPAPGSVQASESIEVRTDSQGIAQTYIVGGTP